MILRKPYAIFIKLFKPMHLILAALVAYLIYLNNKILVFLNEYLYSTNNIVGDEITIDLINDLIYVLPIVIIVISLLVLGIMFKKRKNFAFYIFNIFLYVVVLIISIYSTNFLKILEQSIVAVKSVKLIHDLILINIIAQIISFICFAIRGIGLNFKSFDFDSDLSKIEISESDKEEFEVNINVDLNEKRRNRRKLFRNIKYFYFENKFLINLFILIFVLILGIIIYFVIINSKDMKTEGNIYSVGEFDFGVESTSLLNTDYRGNKITDNYLVVVNCKIKSNHNDNLINMNDFSLKIGDAIFKPTTKYSNSVADMGLIFDEDSISTEYNNYLFVYEIYEKYITSEMIFKYNNLGSFINIKLKPKSLDGKKIKINKKITEKMSFEKSLGNINFKINNYDIKEKYLIEYNYCIKEDQCFKSKEYLKASFDENFDKYILKLNVEYNNETNLDADTFYDFFSKFGSVYYNINGTWYLQNSKFEQIKSTKLSEKNVYYIGVNPEISKANNIKFLFAVRNYKYEYVIK